MQSFLFEINQIFQAYMPISDVYVSIPVEIVPFISVY